MSRVCATSAVRLWPAAKGFGLFFGMLLLAGLAFAQPGNDNFSAARTISGPSGMILDSNVGATKETDEPAHAGLPGGASIWYKWTAPSDGTVIFDTTGSLTSALDPMDTLLAAYTGTNLAALTAMAGNDDASPTNSSSLIAFAAVAGVEYLIALDVFTPSEVGTAQLNWRMVGGGGMALNAGAFRFATHNNSGLYTVSERESSPPLSASVNPSIAAARFTITRVGGAVGRVLVDYEISGLLYTNRLVTNYWGTNIYMTNIVDDVPYYTNVFITNAYVTNFYQNYYNGQWVEIQTKPGWSETTTNENGQISSTSTNLGQDEYGNPPVCLNQIVDQQEVGDPPTNIVVTEVFCYIDQATNFVNSAQSGVDFTTPNGTLEFDDYQMSGFVDVDVTPSQGPNFPRGPVVNRYIQLRILDVRLDPLESPDVTPPTIDAAFGSAAIQVLDNQIFANSGLISTNAGSVSIFNFERKTFRVREATPGSAVIYVTRGGAICGTHSVKYRIDYRPPENQLNEFPLQAGSDYARPDVDFTSVTGTLSWGDRDGSPKPITIPILDDNIVEFNEDLLVQLYEPEPAAPADCPGGWARLGNVNTATVTILFEDVIGLEQPAGALDRTHNKDDQPDTVPPFNPTPGANNTVYSVAVQPDGKTLIAGNFTAFNTVPHARIARMNFDGSVDNTFLPPIGTVGQGANAFIASMALQPDGKILVGGGFTAFNGTNRFHIARLNSNGTLDTTFAPGLATDGTVWAIALQGDGKILIGGEFTFINGTNRNYVARLNANGTLDTTFDPGVGPDAAVMAIAVQGNNVLIGGDFDFVGGVPRSRIARLTETGALDVAFDPLSGANDSVYAIVVQPDGRILVGGAFTTMDLLDRNRVARLNSSGSLDLSFNPGLGANDTVYSLLLQPDGRIFVGGLFTDFNETRRVGLTRLYSHGPVDTTFLDTSYNQFAGVPNHYYDTTVINPALYPSGNQRCFIYTIGLQPDGNVIIGGNFSRIGGGYVRDDIRNRSNVARLIGRDTPGPGNIELVYQDYTVDEDNQTLYVSLLRTNGFLGTASVTFSTNVPPPGPGAASPTDFGLDPFYSNPTWPAAYRRPMPDFGWELSEAMYNYNFSTEPYVVRNADVFISIVNNTNIDGTRIGNLRLSDPSGTDSFFLGGENIPNGVALGRAASTMTIVDDDALPGVLGFSSDAYTVNEDGVSATITVTRTNGSEGVVTVQYSTLVGGAQPATAGADYTTRSGTLTFNQGQVSRTFTVPIVNDPNVELDETILLRLANPNGGASLGLTNSVLTIIDNDFSPGRVNFSSASYSTNEDMHAAVITVTRSGGSAGVLAVYYATSNGTAAAGIDYIGVTNFVSWANGDTAPKTFVVPLFDDVLIESNETVNLRLFSPTVNGTTNNVALGGTTSATLTILNDDFLGAVRFSTTDYTINENGGHAYITVVRTGGSAETVAVNFSATNGTAVAGFDFVATNGVLTFGPGVFSRTFTVPILNNAFEDGNRFISVALNDASPTNGLGAPSAGIVTILDDESLTEPPGSLDTAYDPAAGLNGDVFALALQPDGQLIVGGDFTVANAITRNRIVRLQADGSLDFKFSTTTGGFNETVRSVAVQTDGRVLVAGDFTTANAVNRSRIARLNSNGTTDETFDTGSGADNPVHVVVETFIGDTRRVLIGGEFTVVNGIPRNHIARLTESGTVDATFNNLGNGPDDAVYAIVVQPDGKIVIGGSFTSVNGVARNHIARLNSDGSLDLAFDPGAGADNTIRAIALQLDGRILIGGLFTAYDGTARSRYARLNPDGSLDLTFTPGVGANDTVNSIVVQNDTRIVLGGQFTRCNGVTRNHVTRLNNDGTVDPTINFGAGANNFVAPTVVQPDGKIIIGGGFTEYDGTPRPRLARIYGGSIAGSGTFEFTAAEYVVGESGTNATITVRRRGGTEGLPPGNSVTVDAVTSDGTATNGLHYTGGTTQLSFPPGEVLQSFILLLTDDFEINADRTINLALTNILPANSAALGNQPIAQITVVNDDSAITFSSPTYSRNENAIDGKATIEVVRSGSTVGAGSVEFLTTTNGTATAGADFTMVTNFLVFNPGETSKLVTIPIVNDSAVEGDETIIMVLTNAIGALQLAPAQAVLTIVDDDFAPGRIGFGTPTYSFAENVGTAVVAVIRTNGRSGAVSASYFTSDNTANAGLDYAAASGSVVFADGETNKTILIPITNDTVVEGAEFFNLTLTNVTGGATLLSPTTVPVNILDNDVGLTFSSPVFLVGENGPTVTITVLRINGSNGVATVNYTTTNGTAQAAADYTATTGLLTFNNGETIKTFTIPILEDTTVEGDETFGVILSNPSSGVVLLNGSANVTILDNDTGLGFGPAEYVVDEVSTNLILTVVRSNASTLAPVTVAYGSSNTTATAGADYVAAAGVLTFTNGEAAKTISIPILEDAQVEGDESFTVALFNPTGGAQFTGPTLATVTIVDNDAGLSFASDDYAVIEGGVQQTITVLRTGITNSTVSVSYLTSDGTATNGADYVGVSGLLTFTNGETVKTFSISVIDDTVEEGPETVLVKLSAPTGQASLLDPNAATLTIVDNDGSLILPAGILLTAESGSVSNAVEVGETVTALFAMRNISGINTTNLVATLLATNGITSPSGAQSYGTLVSGGASVSRPFTFTASATNGSVIGATFQLQDGPVSYGRVTFNILIGTSTATFSNLAAVVINDPTNATPAAATPYPSVINVAGLGGSVSKAVVTLTNLAHRNPDDVDILVASPGGRSVLLMSDAGGGNLITNVTLTFDDAAAAFLPDSSQITTGTNKPSNYVTGDFFPQPAPQPVIPPGGVVAQYNTNLATFNGSNPNGAWSLYMVDDAQEDTGVLARGWYLHLTMSGVVPASADVSVTMAAAPSPGILGSNLVYTVLVTNHGPWSASGVSLTNDLPANATFVSASAGTGTIATNGGGQVIWTIGNLAKDAAVSATITVRPTVAATISSTSLVVATQPDPNAANSTATVSAVIANPSADLVLGMTDAPDPLSAGGTLTYSLSVTNKGPATATAVTITDTLPAGFTFLSAVPAGYTVAGNVVTFTNLGSLGSGQWLSATLAVRANSPGEYTNSATANSTVLDPLKGNNTAAVKTIVEGTLASPTISFAVVGNQLLISWPTTAVGFNLESATNLVPPVVWSPVPVAPVVVGSSYVVTNAIGSGNQFFRLRAPVP